MKKNMSLLSAGLFAALFALSSMGIAQEAGITLVASSDSQENDEKLRLVASALLAPSIKQEVDAFSKVSGHITSIEVKKNGTDNTIVLSKVMIREGDIACGYARLIIAISRHPGFFMGGWYSSYTAQVHIPRGC